MGRKRLEWLKMLLAKYCDEVCMRLHTPAEDVDILGDVMDLIEDLEQKDAYIENTDRLVTILQGARREDQRHIQELRASLCDRLATILEQDIQIKQLNWALVELKSKLSQLTGIARRMLVDWNMERQWM
jgi:hypothetical protein